MPLRPFAPISRDAELRSSQAFPAANATADSDGWKIPHGANSAPPINVEVLVGVPDLPLHSDTADTITFALQDSADGVTYAALNPAVTLSLVGIASVGTTADETLLPIPTTAREYVLVRCTNPSGGPAITGSQWNAGIVVRPI